MADGGCQSGFAFPANNNVSRLHEDEIVVDFFAGGGGASEALKEALGRDPDVAVNHDHDAIGMHAANHPFTRHLEADVWMVDILGEVAGRPVGWFHASPDCTDFSQAKGGQPRSKATRSLSWVVLKVAGKLSRVGLAPRIISLENVKQILQWCPLIAKRDKATGRVVTLEMVPKIDPDTGKVMKNLRGKVIMVHRVADRGEQVPRRNQFLVPDKRHLGRTWNQFVAALRALGYVVEWRLLKACDYGAGTIRERLFLIARRDGVAIRWPDPSHGPGCANPFVTAADCIDWSIAGRSIFNRKRPLADATMRRIAKGVHRYVLGSAEPFIIPLTHHGERRVHPNSESFPTITGAHRGELAAVDAIIAPLITEHANASTQRIWPGNQTLRTQVSGVKGGHFSVAAASLVKFRGDSGGASVDQPSPVITSGAGAARPAGAAHALGVMTACLAKLRGTSNAADALAPLGAASAGGQHHAVVECTLSPEHEEGALQVAAFLMRYHGTGGQHSELSDPTTTITAKDRLALVTVTIRGTPYVIVDITLRMLRPEELFRAQGFRRNYIINRTASGKPLSISASVKMCGNSVSPPPLFALASVNLEPAEEPMAVAA